MKLWSGFIIRVVGSSYFTLVQFFFSIFPYQCNGSFYSGEGLTNSTGGVVGRKYSFMQLSFFLSSCGVKIETKTAVYETTEET